MLDEWLTSQTSLSFYKGLISTHFYLVLLFLELLIYLKEHLLLFNFLPACFFADKTSVEKNLIRKLLDRYHQFGVVGRPVEHSEKLIVVHYGLALIQILDLDENMQVLRTNCWSRYVSFAVEKHSVDQIFSLSKSSKLGSACKWNDVGLKAKQKLLNV